MLNAFPYSPTVAALVFPRRLNPLTSGERDEDARARLEALRQDTAFAPYPIRDQDMATACLAGLWLYHNFVDDAHRTVEDIVTPTGVYWHALVHRREPDFKNAAYWFHELGRHPTFGPLRDAAANAAAELPQLEPAAHFLVEQRAWDPFAFLGLVQAVVEGRSSSEALCREIQQREWELLFDYSYRHAIGAADTQAASPAPITAGE